jgi:pSer/pThr/pTyr-binding forkhead associated (FHA) protein
MTQQLLQTVIGAVLLVTSLAAWVAGILYVTWDAGRRPLPAWQRHFWTLLAFWPLFGFTLYVLVAARAALADNRRVAGGLRLRADEGLPPRQRVTLPRPAIAARRRFPTQPAGDADPARRPDYIPTAPVSAVRRAPVSAPAGNGVPSPANASGAGVSAPVQPSAPASPVMALAALEGPHAGERFELRELPARIGRGAEVAIRLDADLGVSRRHAELYLQAGVLRLRDTNSAHGTTVNGYTITDKGLAPGDRIRVGHSLLQLQLAGHGSGGEA